MRRKPDASDGWKKYWDDGRWYMGRYVGQDGKTYYTLRRGRMFLGVVGGTEEQVADLIKRLDARVRPHDDGRGRLSRWVEVNRSYPEFLVGGCSKQTAFERAQEKLTEDEVEEIRERTWSRGEFEEAVIQIAGVEPDPVED